MSGNSLDSLLERMKDNAVTQGWGAIHTMNRGRLNRLLEQQYIQRFNTLNFLPLLNGRWGGVDSQYKFIELEGVSLSQPLLSFNSASLINSTAVLTMNIVAGRFTTSYQPPGAEKVLMSTFNIKGKQAFTLEMEINLSMVVGEIDRQGKVILNLSEAVSFRCNLGGDEETNERLAEFFKQHFDALPRHRSVFQLGMVDLIGYGELTPKSFRILTQAAPGAKVLGALNYGDGGVVVLMQLRGNGSPGRFPPTDDLPFFIPDDQENGSDKYSASLVLAADMIPYIGNGQLDVLSNLLYPGENYFAERERHTPRDLAIFGNISPQQTLITLEPAFQTIEAGETQRYTLRNWKGEVIQASNWQAVSLVSHNRAGHGTIESGLYTAPSRARIGFDTVPVVVTAEYVNAGITYTASALLQVEFENMTIAPQVATCSTIAASQSVELTASAIDNAPVTWKLLAPEYGTLSHDGERGLFTADARSRAKGLAVQEIEATGTQTSQASVLLLNAQQLLRVEPSYVPSVMKATVVPLKDDTTLLPDIPRRWKVVGGGGTVDASGHFTAPAQGITSSSVVQCEIVRNGVVFSSGYSVINHSELEPEPSWKDLSQFTIKVPGGPDMQRLGSLDANGYQQLRVQIVAETSLVDGQEYPLSVTEKASMRLFDNTSKAEIGFVDEAFEGIPEGDEQVWLTRQISNRFALSIPRVAGEDSQALAPISVQDMYLHTRERAGASATFGVTFQADSDNRWWKSTDMVDINNKIDVTPLPIPPFEQQDYVFQRARVDGSRGGAGGRDPDDDDFDFHLRTVDYWTLSFEGRPGYPGTTFETFEFLPVDGTTTNLTTIRWESEQLAEEMFSWTGYIFQDPLRPANVQKIKFDEATKDVVKGESLDINVNQSMFEQGKLVISLHRSDRVPYIRNTNPSRAKLSRDLAVRLIDKNGNPHMRRISYLPSSNVGDRNKLEQRLFTPSLIDDHQFREQGHFIGEGVSQ